MVATIDAPWMGGLQYMGLITSFNWLSTLLATSAVLQTYEKENFSGHRIQVTRMWRSTCLIDHKEEFQRYAIFPLLQVAEIFFIQVAGLKEYQQKNKWTTLYSKLNFKRKKNNSLYLHYFKLSSTLPVVWWFQWRNLPTQNDDRIIFQDR